MSEKDKMKIRTRVSDVIGKRNELEANGENLPRDILGDIDELEAEMNIEIAKNAMSGQKLLRIVDSRSIEIEKIMKNYG